jgi:hypothetical protein
VVVLKGGSWAVCFREGSGLGSAKVMVVFCGKMMSFVDEVRMTEPLVREVVECDLVCFRRCLVTSSFFFNPLRLC